jgi:hypothetical protein
MKGKNNFDQTIRSKLENYNSPVPAAVWSNISTSLPGPRKKFRLLIILPLLILGLLSIGYLFSGSFGTINSQAEEQQNLQILANESANTSKPGVKAPVTNKTTAKEQLIADNSIVENNKAKSSNVLSNNPLPNNQASALPSSTEINSEQGGSQSIGNTARKTSEPEKLEHISMIKATDTKRIDETDVKIEQSATRASSEGDSHEMLNSNSEKQNTEVGSDVISVVELSKDDVSEARPTAESDLESKGSIPVERISETGDVGLQLDRVLKLRRQLLLESLPRSAKLVESLSKEGSRITYDPCIVRGIIDCYEQYPGDQFGFLDLSLAPLYSFKTLRAKGIEAESYKDVREDSEGYLSSYSVSGRAGVIFNNGILLASGLTFERLNEKFDYFDPEEQRITVTRVVTDTMVNGNVITYTYDTLSIVVSGERRIKHTNKLTFLSLPIQFGYNWQFSRFDISVMGGFLVNLAFWKEGRIIREDGSLHSFENDGTHSVYKRNAGISVIGSIGLSYELDNDLRLIIEPQARYALSNLTVQEYPLEQKYLHVGISLGIRKILTSKAAK